MHLFQNIVNNLFLYQEVRKRNFGRLIIRSCMQVWKYDYKYEKLLLNVPYLTPVGKK